MNDSNAIANERLRVVHTLTRTLTSPYSNHLTSNSYHAGAYTRFTSGQNINPQGYTYSSTYNPLAPSPRPFTSSRGFPAPRLNNVPSGSSSGNKNPSRGPPSMHWHVPGNIKCTYPACTFTGSANSVETHMMDRHLIYPPGWNIQKRQGDWDADPSLKGKPIPILGTNIRLETPEDVEAWIAERKRRWPTAARVVEKRRKLEEAMANGGLQPDYHTFSRNKRPRLAFNTEATRTRWARGGSGFSGRGRGSGAGHRGPRHVGGLRGTTPAEVHSSLLPTVTVDPQSSLSPTANNASDSDPGLDSDAPEMLSAKRPPGIEAYESSSDAEPQVLDCHLPPASTEPPSSGSRIITAAAAPSTAVARARLVSHPRQAQPPQPKKLPQNPFAARPSLLRNLLLPEIRMTVSNLSQAIHFLVSNDFFENVELKPGQADQKRIEIISMHPTEPEAETT
ncbi:nuclear fragile X mental retardation-interacting protein 1-domain-containing protein [Multifurca ochricompacta]|uniref:Nuclear fragile X mental retardation-interacting protein 1-domain-containing protein n=1 Tax=Multifurca ochricompacta TaxID=376703 RepID=A0AAD4QRL7_9AGAM|nr:nuclear fragile X mental retardation-interacting protein 1-domain-containing protein [Multifurca ochricompacta]